MGRREKESAHGDGCLHASEVKTWLDGELAPSRAPEVSRHIAGCACCRRLAEDARDISARVRAAEGCRPELSLDALCRRARNARRERDGVVRLLKLLSGVAAVLLFATWIVATQERVPRSSALSGTPPVLSPDLEGDVARFDPEFDMVNRSAEAPAIVPTSGE